MGKYNKLDCTITHAELLDKGYKWYDTTAYAEICGYSAYRILQFAAEGHIDTHRIGRRQIIVVETPKTLNFFNTRTKYAREE